ncbi:MAG: tetraacyldisaccharide 4'-kinase [Pirellulaceae bacterium]|nr:tetraacyldisaccharide 4'-kinase [Pirellulaceae bacterium]
MTSWREWLTRSNPRWYDRLARYALRCASLLYYVAILLRNRLFDWGWNKTFRSPLPIVSVGNLSVGGTGKSPVVAWIARWLRQRNLRVAILSRGYGQLDSGRNDEALELELKFPDVPHLQHWDRIASAQLAHEELEMQVLLLDDGFQHRRLARDLDIVLIDATDTPAAQWLLPAGLRREPMSSLSRAQAVIITRADHISPRDLQRIVQQVHQHQPTAVCVHAIHRPVSLWGYPDQHWSLDIVVGAKILAFCGIGNPVAFFDTLKRLGAELVGTHCWPDHHAYSAEDVQWLRDWASQHTGAKLVCTVKDLVKLQTTHIGSCELLALEIELEIISGQSELEQLLRALINQLKLHQSTSTEFTI